MERKRVPGYITKKVSRDFGNVDTTPQRQVYPNSEFYPSGQPIPEGRSGLAPDEVGGLTTDFRDPIPPGAIGSREGQDEDTLGPPQYIDTVADYRGSQNDVSLHDPLNAVRSGGRSGIPFQDYASFTPRSAPMPRAAQDETFLRGAGKNLADPRMIDRDSSRLTASDRNRDLIDLYGLNKDGMVDGDIDVGSNPKTDQNFKRPK
jgi:hypothetical protein